MTSYADGNDTHVVVETATSGSELRIVLRGEVDVSNVEHLETALDDVPLDGHETVSLDLSDLEFVDVAALRQLAMFAMKANERQRRVAFVGAPPVVQRALRVLDGGDFTND